MEEIIQSIYASPESWTLDEHHFTHGDIKIWIANGRGALAFRSGPALPMSWGQRRKLWKAFQWWCDKAPLGEITGDKMRSTLAYTRAELEKTQIELRTVRAEIYPLKVRNANLLDRVKEISRQVSDMGLYVGAEPRHEEDV